MKEISTPILASIFLLLVTFCAASSAQASGSTNNLKHAQNAPFDDPVNVTFVDLDGGATISYFNNNGVNISGPTNIPADGTYQIHVTSNNFDDGDPYFIIDGKCKVTFDDGPWTYLSYNFNKDDPTPPKCSFYQISTLTATHGYKPYYMTITSLANFN